MSEEKCVPRDELLYRRVPNRPGDFYKPIDGGKHRVTSGAFGGRRGLPISEQRPSVDRAKLLGYDPAKSKRPGKDDYVVSFTVDEVKRIKLPGRTVKVVAKPIENEPDLPDNPAHAEITVDRPFETKGQFDKLKQALARVADSKWEIPPPPAAAP